jgi:hypothetical protein
MNEKGTHDLGTVDMTLRYHFETGRGGSQSRQSSDRVPEGRVAETLGGQSPVDGEGPGEGLGQGPTMRSRCS